MKTSERLQPLFDIVCKIHCDTDIPLVFSVEHFDIPNGNTIKSISWYIGDVKTPAHGAWDDWIYIDDLDEDRLDVWIDQLTYLYRDAMGLCEDNSDEESIAEEHRAENATHDQQELAHDRRERT